MRNSTLLGGRRKGNFCQAEKYKLLSEMSLIRMVSNRVLQLELPEHGVRLVGTLREENPIGWDNWHSWKTWHRDSWRALL